MSKVWQEQCIFSPSMICLDLCNLEQQVKELEKAGVKVLHVDLLDGHFSPSMPIGLEVVKQLRAKTDMEFDVHLMTKGYEYYVHELLDIGVQQIVFHLEEESHVDGLLNKIKAHGVRAGVALKPATPLCTLDYVIEKCDTVLLMLINPGYASSAKETQVHYAKRKIEKLATMIRDRRLETLIEIDGRVSEEDIRNYAEQVQVFVTGSTCFKGVSIQEDFCKLNQLILETSHN